MEHVDVRGWRGTFVREDADSRYGRGVGSRSGHHDDQRFGATQIRGTVTEKRAPPSGESTRSTRPPVRSSMSRTRAASSAPGSEPIAAGQPVSRMSKRQTASQSTGGYRINFDARRYVAPLTTVRRRVPWRDL